MSAPAGPAANALTIDVEDWFQVENYKGVIRRADWEGLDRRVVRNTDRLLDLFAAARVRATFFVLGWVAFRHPDLVRRIVAAGHELASHGYGHARVVTLAPMAFRKDVRAAKRLLEEKSTLNERIDFAWRLAAGRAPTAAEVKSAVKYLDDGPDKLEVLKEFALVLFNMNPFLYVN